MHWKAAQSIFLILVGLISVAQETTFYEVEVISSRFTILGKTNINTFECQLEQNEFSENLFVKSSKNERTIKFEGLRLHYLINDFECGIEGMNKDMKKTLKGDLFPCLFLEINDIVISDDNTEIERLSVHSTVTITIAGEEREVVIEKGSVINHSEDTLTLLGNKSLLMTDFNIEPPTKFFGFIQVTDELNVSFEIRMNTRLVN